MAPFHELCARGEIASALQKTDEDGRSLLHLAAASGSLPLVQLLGESTHSSVAYKAGCLGVVVERFMVFFVVTEYAP